MTEKVDAASATPDQLDAALVNAKPMKARAGDRRNNPLPVDPPFDRREEERREEPNANYYAGTEGAALALANEGRVRLGPNWGEVLPEPTQWIIEGLIPESSCLVLGAEQKTGKTWITIEMALALALAGQVLDRWKATRKGKTLFYSPEGSGGGEISRDAFYNRLKRMCWGAGLGRDGDPLDLGDAPNLIRRYPGRLDVLDDQSLADLAATILEFKPDLLVLDPLISCYRGVNENDNSEIQEALDRIRDLRPLNPGMSILVAHHHNKAGADQKNPWNSLRGASALAGWTDGLITLKNPDGGPDDPRRMDAWFRDERSPEPIGFVFIDGPSDCPGVGSFKLGTCPAPVGRSSKVSSKKKSGKDRAMETIRDTPGKWTRTALSKELQEMLGVTDRTIRTYITELSDDGKVEIKGDKLWPVAMTD